MYMQAITILPRLLQGTVRVPPSKSLAHRAVLCAALAQGESRISNIALSDDIAATLSGVQALGAEARLEGDSLTFYGLQKTPDEQVVVDCNESGSTLRFLLPLFLALGRPARFVGRGNLGKRPLTVYEQIMEEQGIRFEKKGDLLDLQVKGQLRPGTFCVPGNISSQFITGLLFALPLLKGSSVIEVEGRLESKGYLDLTLDVLGLFGIEVINEEYRRFRIPGGQQYRPADYRVEGDYSAAAFFLCAGALGNPVTLEGLIPHSRQGDKEVLQILQTMGAGLDWQEGTVSCRPHSLQGCTIDAAQCPDIIPPLAAVAALARGQTRIINASRLRIKECDRLHAVAKELGALGADITEGEDFLTIRGVQELAGGTVVDSHLDHRMAMTLAVAATRCKAPIVLRGPGCVAKSYPGFYEDYTKLGGMYHEFHVGESL